MRATWRSRPRSVFMGRSVKPMSNRAISIDGGRQSCFPGPNGESQCNIILTFDLIKKSCWKLCHVPITWRPAGQLTVIEGNFAACGDIQEVQTTIGPLQITVSIYTVWQATHHVILFLWLFYVWSGSLFFFFQPELKQNWAPAEHMWAPMRAQCDVKRGN